MMIKDSYHLEPSHVKGRTQSCWGLWEKKESAACWKHPHRNPEDEEEEGEEQEEEEEEERGEQEEGEEELCSRANFLCKRFNMSWEKNPWHPTRWSLPGDNLWPGTISHKSASPALATVTAALKMVTLVWGSSLLTSSLFLSFIINRITASSSRRHTARTGRKSFTRLNRKVVIVHPTRQHGEHGGEGVEFESVDDIAGVEKLETHETEADHQQQDVEHLRHHRQPQHTCKHDTRSDTPPYSRPPS